MVDFLAGQQGVTVIAYDAQPHVADGWARGRS
jgi:hypothetical protein